MTAFLHILAYVGLAYLNFGIYEVLTGFCYAGLCLALEKRNPESENVRYMLNTCMLVVIFFATIMLILSFFGFFPCIPYPKF